MIKRNVIMVLGVLILASSCSGKKSDGENLKVQPVMVAVSKVSESNGSAVLGSGQVEAAQTANISTRIMGRITNIYVKMGDHVSKGQLLATISDEDIKAKRAQTSAMIAEAESAHATAQKDYDRFSNLFKQQSATAKELENVTLQYNSARARLEAAKQMRNEVNAMLAYSSLTAPFAGVVTQKLAEEGNIANPGMPVLTIEQNGILQVSASIAESDISKIHMADAVDMTTRSSGQKFRGNIIQINPSSQFTGGQYIIKISIPESMKKELYSGMFVGVSIPIKDNTAQTGGDMLMIPLSAIVHREELTGVYTVSSNNTAILRWLRLGKTYGDKVEVLSGLSKDEQFISQSEGKLFNGVPVKIK